MILYTVHRVNLAPSQTAYSIVVYLRITILLQVKHLSVVEHFMRLMPYYTQYNTIFLSLLRPRNLHKEGLCPRSTLAQNVHDQP